MGLSSSTISPTTLLLMARLYRGSELKGQLGHTFSQDSSRPHELKVFRFIDLQVLNGSVREGRMSICRRDGKAP